MGVAGQATTACALGFVLHLRAWGQGPTDWGGGGACPGGPGKSTGLPLAQLLGAPSASVAQAP